MSDVACGSCGASNRAGAKFCSECGAAMVVTCPACGAPVTGGRFCSECGTALAGTAAPAGPASVTGPVPPGGSAPVSERRVVSLLFADLVGFTPLSESRDPEAVRELLSAYFDRARAVVERFGGTVEKFIGDAVFAVWGVPAAREDDAERAVRAGLDLVSAVAALGEEVGAEGLQMRVGVTTGQVAVTLGVVGEGMVAGDAVNTASRVQSVAGPGEVWVDDTTRSLTTAALAYESTGSHELKGKSLPIELFRTVRTTAVLGGDQRVDGLEAPFVGRDRELRLVKELFHATAEDSRPRLVLVAGEPGIGKSRLAWEFEKYLHAITSHTTWWMRGRCLSYGQGVAGRVVAEMIRSHLRVTDTDEDDVVRGALNDRLEQNVADAAERDILRPRLESLLGLSDKSFDQADMFACWRGFLEALTSDGSLVTLLVEDLQWADDAFLDFVEHLLEAARSPIMILALARPEVTTRRAGIGAGRRSTTVFLEPLSETVMGKLLDGLVGNLPATLRDELVRRADGVPLYAVETVRSLIDRDVVVPAGGRYVVDADALGSLDLAALAPPASLHALLAARLDALTPDERRVVQDGSVLGLTFTRAGIEALTPPGVDLDAALAALRAKEILGVDSDPRSPERGQFRFVQALLRGVAYDTLSRRDRKARHIAAAEHLATISEADAIAGVLAAHYLDAARAVPEDSDEEELRLRAAELFELAAQHATDIGAPKDALAHYELLFGLDVPDDLLIRAAVAASELARRTGTHVDEAQTWLAEAMAAAERSGSEHDALQLRVNRAGLLSLLSGAGSRESLEQARQEARTVFEASLEDPSRVHLLARATRQLCISAQFSGGFEEAQRVTTLALPQIERFGDDNDFSNLLDAMSMWFGIAGYRRLTGLVRRAAIAQHHPRDPNMVSLLCNLAAQVTHDVPAEARAAAIQAIDVAQSMGHNDVMGAAHCVVADITLGQWADAERILAARPVDEISQIHDWETYLVVGAAMLAWLKGDPSLLRPRLDAEEPVDDPVVAGWWLMNEAAHLALAGDAQAGLRSALLAVERMHGLGPAHEDMPIAYAFAVDMALHCEDLAALEQVTEPLETLARGQRFRLMDGQLHRAQAHLGNDPVTRLRRAIEVFDAMEAAYWAARCRVELAEALAAAGEPDLAQGALAEAEPLLREIGAAPALARIDRLRAAVPAG